MARRQAPAPARGRSRGKELAVRLVAVSAAGIGASYIGWRLLFTLNPDAMWLSIPVWAAEAFGFFSSLLFFFMVWDPYRRAAPPAPRPGLTVDILIPTYNEPAWIVRRTLLGALGVRYPHEVWLLDDGNRAEMKALAEQLGVHYLARGENTHAKAGNLNHALEHTSGEFVAIFDADHVPMPEFLDKTLGYFEDERMAFVQTPQEFYNVDSYQHRLDRQRKRLWHEQALFYRVIQPGKDRWNAAFFCGSCAVVRRSALQSVGGIATGTVTEDLHTSIKLHARGWRSAYQSEVLAYGLAPQTAVPYHVQRLRWGQGAMQVFRQDNPLFVRGLTPAQRVNYLASITTYFEGYQKLVYYLAPPAFLLTGLLPIRAMTGEFLLRFLGYSAVNFLAFKLATRGYGMGLLTEGYNMTRFYTFVKASFGLFARRRLKFAVTGKDGHGRTPVAAAIPYLVIAGLAGAAVVVGIVRTGGGQGMNPIAFWGNVAWSLWHLGLGLWATRLALRTSDQRGMHRAEAGLPIGWTSDHDSGAGVLVDVHEEGGSLLVREWDGRAKRVGLTLRWPGEDLQRAGEVRWVRKEPSGVALGLRWLPDGGSVDPLATLAMTFGQRKFLRDVDRPTDRLGLLDFRRNIRRERRVAVAVPVLLLQEGGPEVWGVTEDVSLTGALVLLPEPVERGTRVRIAPWGDEAAIEGSVAWVQRLDLPPHTAYRVGINRGSVGRAAPRQPKEWRFDLAPEGEAAGAARPR